MAKKLFTDRRGYRKTLLIFGSITLGLITLDHQQPQLFAPIKKLMDASFDPVMQAGELVEHSKKVIGIQGMSKTELAKELASAQAEKDINLALLSQLSALKQENNELRQWLNLVPKKKFTPLAVEVIGQNNNGDLSLILDKGSDSGLKIGQMVVDSKGVMGQITAVYPKTSRLLLIGDSGQSVSVRNLRTGRISTASGQGNYSSLSLDYIPNTDDIEVGDVMVTSGLGSRYLAGFPIGVVKNIKIHGKTEFSDIELTPMASLNASTFLVAIDEQHQALAGSYQIPQAPAIDLTNTLKQTPLETLPHPAIVANPTEIPTHAVRTMASTSVSNSTVHNANTATNANTTATSTLATTQPNANIAPPAISTQQGH